MIRAQFLCACGVCPGLMPDNNENANNNDDDKPRWPPVFDKCRDKSQKRVHTGSSLAAQCVDCFTQLGDRFLVFPQLLFLLTCETPQRVDH